VFLNVTRDNSRYEVEVGMLIVMASNPGRGSFILRHISASISSFSVTEFRFLVFLSVYSYFCVCFFFLFCLGPQVDWNLDLTPYIIDDSDLIDGVDLYSVQISPSVCEEKLEGIQL